MTMNYLNRPESVLVPSQSAWICYDYGRSRGQS